MNQPNDDRIDKIEQRLTQLEQDRDGIVESEKLLLKLSKYHRAGLQELNGKAEKIELTQGDTNERLDVIERNMATKDDVARLDGKLDEILRLMQRGQE
jgi:septation ring formation regulator EzrA